MRFRYASYIWLSLLSVSVGAQAVVDRNKLLAGEARFSSTTYGTTDATSYTLDGFKFVPFVSSTTFAYNLGRYVTCPSCYMMGEVFLPAGALVEALEVEGCDASANGSTQAVFVECTQPVGLCYAVAIAESSFASTPGCGYFITSGFTLTIDNENHRYWVQATNGSLDGTTNWAGVRLYYKLQVSSPPPSATFTDVPTNHPFFQFIEALAASGITAGCNASPPQYCPDATLTRGQMAVFLARALGLHWVP